MPSRASLASAALLLAFFASPASAQLLTQTVDSGGTLNPPGSITEGMDIGLRTSNVEIHLLAAAGIALPADAHVRLVPMGNNHDGGTRESSHFFANAYEATSRRGIATINSVEGGEYALEVSAAGYETHREQLSVVPGYGNTRAFVKLRPFDGSSDDLELEQPGAPLVMPGARRELELALVAVKQNQYKDAAKHIQRALKDSPQNPDVHFVAGYVQERQKDEAAARQQYETAIQIFPTHFGAQLALGESLLFAKDPNAAIPHLEKALAVGANSWRGHWLIAEALLQGPRDAERARGEAQRAAQLGKEKASAALVTIAIADAVAGQLETARQELEAFLHNYPSSLSASRAKEMLGELSTATNAAPAGSIVPLTAAAVDPDDLEGVAPEDMPGLPTGVDPSVPPVTAGVPCVLPQVLAGAAARAQEFSDSLERFTAKELVVHAMLDSKGVPKNPKQHSFEYVVSLDRTTPGMIRIGEMRNGQLGLEDFPAQFAVEGIPGLAVVFHPLMSDDFQFTCEGLGEHRGQPAWQVRFEQRPDRPARLHSWVVQAKEYPALLKGRAWLAADSYQILHMDVDLSQPIKPLRLEYQHMSVDYQPVAFPNKQKALWLPSDVVVYCKLGGHFFRQEHDFSGFTLFSTGVQQTLGAPKSGR